MGRGGWMGRRREGGFSLWFRIPATGLGSRRPIKGCSLFVWYTDEAF